MAALPHRPTVIGEQKKRGRERIVWFSSSPMIPRHDGLVPRIRGPSLPRTHPTAPKRSNASAVRKFLIRPLTAELSTPASADGTSGVAENHSVNHERRLFTFLPSADCAGPPCELRVAERFFSNAGDEATSADDESRDDEDGGEDVEASRDTSSTYGKGRGMGSGRGGHRRKRHREPMRLEYNGFLSLSERVGAKSVRLVSTPSPEYRHYNCVLLRMPTSWRTGDDPSESHDTEKKLNHQEQKSTVQEGDGKIATSFFSSITQTIEATLLPRPVLQLWGERGASTMKPGDGNSGSGAGGGSISATWASNMPLRISKKDWKTLDALEADMQQATKWSDSEGSGDSDENTKRHSRGGDDPASMRAKKRVKEEATNAAVRAFLAGSRTALQQQGPDTAHNLPLANGNAVNAASETPLPSTQSVTELSVEGKPFKTAVASAASLLRETATAAAPVTPPSQPSESGPKNHSPLLTLESLASSVVSELRTVESRATASLMELQKRILKQLPEFTSMSEKMKSTAAKPEAVAWFNRSQRALRVWLVEGGHTISSNGTVTFGV